MSLIKQSTQISSIKDGNKSWSSSRSSSAEGPDDPNLDSPTNADPEFISDSFQGKISDEDLRQGMKQLGVSGNDDNKDGKSDSVVYCP